MVVRLFGDIIQELSEWIIDRDRTSGRTMLYLICSMIISVDLALVYHAKGSAIWNVYYNGFCIFSLRML